MALSATASVPAATIYASFPRRLAAALIDDIITLVALSPVILGVADSPLVDAIVFLLLLSYHGILNGRGATVGKRLLGIAVINEWHEPPGIGRGFARSMLPIGLAYLNGLLGGTLTVSGFIICNGLRMLWHPQRQTWHDQMASTYVIKV